MTELTVRGTRAAATALLLALVAPACGGDDGIVGDWFKCEVASCDRLDDDGLRLRGDRAIVTLQANDSSSVLEPGKTYCEKASGGSYTLDGKNLTVVVDGVTVAGTLDLKGDTFSVVVNTSSSITTYKRITPERSTGLCR
jgi:hypothetical protein